MKKILWGLGVGLALLFPNRVHADEMKEVEFFPADPETGLQMEIPNPEIQSKQQITQRQTLPEKFDFNDGGFGTPVRNQGNVELCWAYSGADILTISLKKNFGVDYTVSPNYFNYFYATNAFTDKINPFAQGRQLNGTGNTEILLEQAALDNMGVTEDVLKTPQFDFQIKPMLSQDFLAIKEQQIPMYADKIAMLRGVSYSKGTEEERKKKVNDIKSMIYEYGATTFHYDTNYTHSPDYYNQQTHASYVPIEDIKQGVVPNRGGEWATSNHNIVIVGWDDNYSKENFTKKPQNNGAFKMKGSWGPYSHIKGYFYMSYEDVYLQSSVNVAVNTEKKEYDFNHKYVNGLQGDILNYYLHFKELFLGNVFQTRKSEEELKAISLYTSQNNIKYELYYLNREIKHDEKIFNYKDMTKIGEGIKEFGGVETVKVPTQKIPPNQEYTIIVKYIYPDDVPYFQLRMQRIKESNQDETPHLEKGRSFVSTDGMKDEMDWKDMSGGEATDNPANVWLNAYTTEKKVAIETIQLDLTDITLNVGDETTVNATISPENATNSKIIWKSSDDSIASVSDTGVIKAKKAGNITITAVSEEGQKTAECQVRVGDGKGTFGTVPWTWNDVTQTVEFGEGEFPESHFNYSIRSHIESQKRLNGKKIKKIVFTKPVKLGNSARHLFSYLSELESIEGGNYLDTTRTTDMSSMFENAKKLTKVDVSNWDTGQVTTMYFMFNDAQELNSLDVSDWNTSQVTAMTNMFKHAKKLTSLDVSSWNTSNTENMTDMFTNALKLKALDVSKWDTTKVKLMSQMFYSTGITKLDVSNWNTSNVEYMANVFPKYLEELTLGKEFHFKGETGMVENVKAPYSGRWVGPDVTYSSIKEFVGNYDGTHEGIYKREKNSTTFWTTPWTWDETTQTIEFGAGEFPETNYSYSIRSHIESQKRLDGKKIKKIIFTKPVKLGENASHLFSHLSELESIEGGNYLDTARTTNMSSMFYYTKELTKVDVSNWNTSRVTKMTNMFDNVRKLSELNVSNWDTGQVTTMYSMFNDAQELNGLDVSKWNTSQVTTMTNMFKHAKKLTSLDVSNWNTSNTENMTDMFTNALKLKALDVSKWDTSKVKLMSQMFYSTGITKLDVSNWNTSNVRYMANMFPKYLEELTLGKEFHFKGETGMVENVKAPYSGRWIQPNEGETSVITYATTAEFTQNYDGSQPGTYVREQTK
ncbi:BspA family leucine-rich repeat surface protein [Enterococcus sp. AZ177]|uniref:BspA family leucine-rich repeat surface protein n=1 Tax=unclassified Enterococcus TaxID=2608891 RepID=UPI003D2FB678